MDINILNTKNSVLNNYLAEIRNKQIQTDPLRFRRNIERIGEMMAYEVSKTLHYAPCNVETPLATATVQLPTDKLVVGTILRAGLPMHNGLLSVFDHAESCFISAFRKYTSNDEFEIALQYVATPSLEGKVLMLCDPMLATGMSLGKTYEALKKFGVPKHTHILSVIGSENGVAYLNDMLKDEPVSLWVAAVDKELNSHKYIVPGLGDAGDLAFGEKL